MNLDRQDMARLLDHHMGDDLSANNFCAQQSQMFLYRSAVGFEFSKLPILPISAHTLYCTQFSLGGHAKYINILKTSIDLRQIDGT